MTSTKTARSTKTAALALGLPPDAANALRVRSSRAPKVAKAPLDPKAFADAVDAAIVTRPASKPRARKAKPAAIVAQLTSAIEAANVPVITAEPVSVVQASAKSSRRTRTATTELVTTASANEALVRMAVAVAEDKGLVEALIGVGPTATQPETVVVRDEPEAVVVDTRAARIQALTSGSSQVDKGVVKALLAGTSDQRIALATSLCLKTVGLMKERSARLIGEALAARGVTSAAEVTAMLTAFPTVAPKVVRAVKEAVQQAPAASKATRAKKAASTGPKAKTRLDTIVATISRKGGATPAEIGAALLAEYPNLSARFGGGPAQVESYVGFARTALGHLQAGRLARGEYTGRIVNTAGTYSIKA